MKQENLIKIKKILQSHQDPIGPVSSNIPKNYNGKIKIVIICESPSYAEVKATTPAVCSTGAKIYANLMRAGMLKKGIESSPFCFHTHYPLFMKNGIYLTNIIKYQADYNCKGDSRKKNKNVKSIFSITKNEIFEELQHVTKKYNKPPILIACGSSFSPQIKELIDHIEQLSLRWFVTAHPSRSKNTNCKNYNPQEWQNSSIKTGQMKKIEAWHRKKYNNN